MSTLADVGLRASRDSPSLRPDDLHRYWCGVSAFRGREMAKPKFSSREIVERLQMIEALVVVPLIPEPGKVDGHPETVMAYSSLTLGGLAPTKSDQQY